MSCNTATLLGTTKRYIWTAVRTACNVRPAIRTGKSWHRRTWAHPARATWELPPETKELMRELAQRQRETVNLYVLRDIWRVCVAQQESPQPLRHVVQVGDELPLWAGASSKILLRDADSTLLARIVRGSPYGSDYLATLKEQ